MTDFSGWKYYQLGGVNEGICIVHKDGRYEARLLTDADVVAWLAAGGKPLPA